MKNKFLALLLSAAMVFSIAFVPVQASDVNGSGNSNQTKTQEETTKDKEDTEDSQKDSDQGNSTKGDSAKGDSVKGDSAKEDSAEEDTAEENAQAADDEEKLTQEEITEEMTPAEEKEAEEEAEEEAEAVADQVDEEDIVVDPEDPETDRLSGNADEAFYSTESVSSSNEEDLLSSEDESDEAGQATSEEAVAEESGQATSEEAVADESGEESLDESSSEEAAVATASATGTTSALITDGYTHDARFTNYSITKGVDVSYHNKTIDWNKVKAAGINFAIIRVGYRSVSSSGGLNYDVKYKENLVNAVKAGVKVGVYIYSQAMTVKEAQEEAAYILAGIKGYKVTLPVVFDYEYYPGGRFSSAKSGGLTDQNRTDICLAFANKVRAAGYTPMVYANKSMLTNDLLASQISAKSKIWLARYNSYAGYDGAYEYWQYSSSGRVNGISTYVDMNFHYGSGLIAPILTAKSTRVEKVSLSWDKVSGAAGYKLQRYNTAKNKYETIYIARSGNITSYVDTGLKTYTKYTYRICSYKKVSGKNKCGSFGSAVSVRTQKKVYGCLNSDNLNIRSQMSTSSSVVTEASAGTQVAIINAKSNWYKIKIRVKGTVKKGYVLKKRVTILAKQKIKATAGKSCAALYWCRNSAAKGYVLQRYDNTKKKFVTIKTITANTTTKYKDTGLTSGKTYQYRVLSFKLYKNKKLCGKFSDVLSVTAK